jgi:hypothetical protein
MTLEASARSECGEATDELAVDAGLEREVEVIKALDRREAGGLDARRAAVAVAAGDLLGQHRGK